MEYAQRALVGMLGDAEYDVDPMGDGVRMRWSCVCVAETIAPGGALDPVWTFVVRCRKHQRPFGLVISRAGERADVKHVLRDEAVERRRRGRRPKVDVELVSVRPVPMKRRGEIRSGQGETACAVDRAQRD